MAAYQAVVTVKAGKVATLNPLTTTAPSVAVPVKCFTGSSSLRPTVRNCMAHAVERHRPGWPTHRREMRGTMSEAAGNGVVSRQSVFQRHAVAAERGQEQQREGELESHFEGARHEESFSIDMASADIQRRPSDAGLAVPRKSVVGETWDNADAQRAGDEEPNCETVRGRCLASNGQWCVRVARRMDLQAVASLQAMVFHEPPPLGALNGFFLELFRVSSGWFQMIRFKRVRGAGGGFSSPTVA